MKKVILLLVVFVFTFPLLSIAADSVTPIAPQVAPRNIVRQIQWLADRAQINDLMLSFARALDSRDATAYANNFTADGVVIVHDPSDLTNIITLHKADMPAALQYSLWDVFTATHHIMTNTQIYITGNTATARVYLHAAHVRDNNPNDHWDAGGWYDCNYVRTRLGWKFTRVEMTAVVWAGPSVTE